MQRQIERKKKKKERNSNHIIIITPLSCLFLETELQIPKYFLFVLFLSLYFWTFVFNLLPNSSDLVEEISVENPKNMSYSISFLAPLYKV